MTKIYYLSILAIFKNESHILDEWLNSHIKEGVEHFYLINNDSTDNYSEIIDKYNDRVTLIHIHGNGKQIEAYNNHAEQIIRETEWVAVIDLDEFIFSTEKNTKLVDYVKEYENNNADGIYLPWIMFGSSNFKKQPDSVINNFLNRKSYDYQGAYVGGKSIVKTDKVLNRFECHLIDIIDNDKYVNENGVFNRKEWFGGCPDVYMSESKVKNMKLRIHHYAIQSLEYFMNIKAIRGDALNRSTNNVRNKNYFISYDENEVFDDTLKSKYN